MTNPLKIEVTEAINEAACAAVSVANGSDNDKWVSRPIIRAALTAAFQHPEFVAQFMVCVPEALDTYGDGNLRPYDVGYNQCRADTRASLGRLLGEG